MDLKNEFEVNAELRTVWSVLTDFEKVAVCLPGTQLEEAVGDQYKGSVRVKVGPVNAQYKGRATYLERSRAQGRVVIKGDGHDSRGIGHASAVIAASVVEKDVRRTAVTLKSDVAITGRVAQFGRGVVNEVGAKIIDQFCDNLKEAVLEEQVAFDKQTLEEQLAAASAENGSAEYDGDQPGGDSRGHPGDLGAGVGVDQHDFAKGHDQRYGGDSYRGERGHNTVRKIDLPETESVDLLEAASAPIIKRVLPVVGGAIFGFVTLRWLRKRWWRK